MKRLAVIFFMFITFFLTANLTSQTETSWGDQLSAGVRESSTTAQFTPGRYAFDRYSSTTWALASGSASGWVERYWDTPQRILGVTLKLDMGADVRLQVSYDSNGAWVPIPGAFLSGPRNNSSTVWFPGEMAETKKILITIDGIAADQARLWDVQWILNPSEKPFGKILPKTYTFNQSEYINLKPSRLWEGNIGNTWYEPLWSFPNEVFQTNSADSPAKIFPPYKGHPPTQAEIIWELDGTYDIQVLKSYFQEAGRSIAFEFWDGVNWTQKQTINGDHERGWQRIALSSLISTNRIRITFPRGWEQARFIRQLEVWGKGFEQTPVKPLVVSPVTADGKNHFTITGLDAKDYQLEVTVKGKQTAALQGQWNGVSFTGMPTAYQGEDTIYRLSIDKEQLRDDVQFLQIQAASVIHGVCINQEPNKGQINLGDHYSDGYFNPPVASTLTPTKEKIWTLKNSYKLEKVRFYSTSLIDLTLKIGSDHHWSQIPAVYNRIAGYWEADLQGMEGDQVSVSSSLPFLFNEVQLFGSSMSDDRTSFEIWWPQKGHDVTSSGQDGASLIGWMGDSSMQPLIGKFHPRQADKIFWMPLKDMEFSPDEDQDFSITGQLGTAFSTKHMKIRWKGKETPPVLDQGIALSSVTGNSLTLSGTVNVKNARCFVQGIEVPITNGKFNTAIPLAEGFQFANVTIWDKQKHKILMSFQKPVYRTMGLPVIVLDQPFGDLWSQNNSIQISGRVGNGMGLTLSINDIPVVLQGDAFGSTVALAEGTQTIKLTLTDVSLRKTEKTLTIYRDHTVPVISIIKPTEGQYLANSKVEFQISGGNDPELWWQFNNEEWEAGNQTIKSKIYTFVDAFYTWHIRAQDRSGNISATQNVNFCVDITPPVSFPLTANVTGWTSNNTPTIRFATTDATSGLDYYEYTVDAGPWQRIESPFTLPLLLDGIHTASVRAFDRAGNIRISNLQLDIDTSKPLMPTNFRPVPGMDNITMKWVGMDDGESFQTYRIERNPAWTDGVHTISGKAYGEQEYCDPALLLKDLLEYRIWAVDRAGNESPKTDWFGAQVGIESIPVNHEGSTLVEYEDIIMNMPAGSVAPDILRIQVNEIPLNSLNDKPLNPLASKIFQFTVVRQNGTETEVTAHADLLKPVTVEFTYDKSLLSLEYSEADLQPFYYDDLWGRWIPLEGAYFDTQSHTLMFTTNHLTNFSIQATKAVDLSSQQLRDVEFSPLGTNVGPGQINVSSNGGSVSTSFTELILPGKNGLDLVLKRTYDTGTAQSDAAAQRTPKPFTLNYVIDFNGDKPWKIADGWRFNFPSMKWNGSGLWMTDLDGNSLSFNQTENLVSSLNGNLVTVRMENHEGSDLTLDVVFKRKLEHEYFLCFETGTYYSYTMYNAKLYMKDGRELLFDDHGRVNQITDATGLNKIIFNYDNTSGKIQNIVDTFGRVVSFSYVNVTPPEPPVEPPVDPPVDPPVNTTPADPVWPFNQNGPVKLQSVNLISSFNVTAGGEVYPTVTYNLDEMKLASSTDVGARIWHYEYLPTKLKTSSILQVPPEGYKQTPAKITYVNALSEVRGPGIGRTTIEYIAVPLTNEDTIEASNKKKYVYTIDSNRLLASKMSVFLADETAPQRVTTYAFKLTFANHNQFYTEQSDINNGNVKTVTFFTKLEKTRISLSQAPEAMRDALNAVVGTREDNTEISNYISTIQRTTVSQIDLDTEIQEWDTDHMRMLSRKVIKAETNASTLNLLYDTWGNVTQQIDISSVGLRKSKKQVDCVFYIPEVALGTVAQTMSLPSGFEPVLPAITNNQRNLLASSKTQVFTCGADGFFKANPVTEFEAYTYTPLGQLSVKKRMLDSANWATTTYTYDSTTGQIARTVLPGEIGYSGQATEYKYEYGNVQSAEYKITTTQKDVVLADNVTEDLIQVTGYTTLTGRPAWSKDVDSFKTEYTYDTLGRITNLIKPSLTDQISSTTVQYNDNGLSSTVTNELGGLTTYQFDPLGRLTKVIKKNLTVSKLLSDSEEIITTSLFYDGFDRVVEMHGPSSNIEIDPRRTPDNLKTLFTYDEQDRVISTLAPGATVQKTSVYDNALNQVTVTDELGNRTRQTTDWNGRVLSMNTNLNGDWIGSQTYYDGVGRPVVQIDPNENPREIIFNSFGLESSVTSPLRPVWENGTTITSERPVISKNYYLNGSLKDISQNVFGGTQTTTNKVVNGLGWILRTETPVGSTTNSPILVVTNTYDKRGNKTNQKSGYSTDILKGKSWTYDAQGRVLSETDELKGLTTYEYDKAGNRTKVIDPRQSNTSYTSEFTLSMTYDQFNHLIGAVLPRVGGKSSAVPEVLMAYDGRGNLVLRQEADGIKTTYTYNLRNWLESEVVMGGNITYTTTHQYDAVGHETEVQYPTGRKVKLEYDSLGRVVSEGSETGGWTAFTYDKNGNQLTITDPMHNETQFKYDPDNKLIKTTDAKNLVSLIDYNRLGQPTRTTDNELNERFYTYDLVGRLIREKTPNESILRYNYDGWGNVSKFIDARGTVFTREYTPTNKLWTEQAVNKGIAEYLSYIYDEAGDVKSSNNGVLTQYNQVNGNYQPNSYGLLNKVTWTAGNDSLPMGYAYDNRQRLTGVTLPDGSAVSYTYNTMGELLTIPGWVNGNIGYNAGRISGYQLKNGVSKTVGYDIQDRVTSLGYTAESENLKEYRFTYDMASNIVSKNENKYDYDVLNQLVSAQEKGWFQQQPEDVAPSFGEVERDYEGTGSVDFDISPIESANINVTLDEKSKSVSCDLLATYWINKIELRPQVQEHRVRKEDLAIYVSQDEAVSGQSQHWVKVDAWTIEKNKDDGSYSIFFPKIIEVRYIKIATIWDDRNELNESISLWATFKNTARDLIKVWTLVKALNESYTYDGNGNRTALNNQVNEYYTNPRGGHLAQIKHDGTWYYIYDAAGNRTAKGKKATGSGNNIQIDTSEAYWIYTWDLHNRLIKVEQHNGISVSYVYDAQNYRVKRTGKDGTTIYAYGRQGALAYQWNPETKLARSYVYLDNQIIGWNETLDGSTKPFFAVTDQLGSVTQITDGDAKVVWESEYLPFGNMAGAQGSSHFDGMYTGKDVDSETGLTYHWNRWRSEDGSTFISEDPARDGMNWYGYCGNNPMNSTDPSGLTPWKEPSTYRSYSVFMPVQQQALDARYYFSPTTNSCKTASIINSYLGDGFTSITIEQIDKVILNENGSIKSSIAADGSPADRNVITKDVAKVLGQDSFLAIGNKKNIVTYESAIVLMYAGNDPHYVYRDHIRTLDSLDPNRDAASTYADFSQQNLTRTSFPEPRTTEIFTQTVSPTTTTTTTNTKIICHELYLQGLMDEDIHFADEAFGLLMSNKFPIVLKGYQIWAKPIVRQMQKSENFTVLVNYFAKPWSIEMAHLMGVKAKGNFLGLLLMIVGLPICGLIGLIAVSFTMKIIVMALLIIIVKKGKRKYEINQRMKI